MLNKFKLVIIEKCSNKRRIVFRLMLLKEFIMKKKHKILSKCVLV